MFQRYSLHTGQRLTGGGPERIPFLIHFGKRILYLKKGVCIGSTEEQNLKA